MKPNKTHFYTNIMCFTAIMAMIATNSIGATAQRVAVTRSPVARVPVLTTTTLATTQPQADITPVDVPSESPAPDVPTEIVVENKASQFNINIDSGDASDEIVDSTFADKIRAQRNAVNAATANTVNENAIQTYSNGRNSCDSALRKCMQDKCGTDYTKCATDTDTTWGMKMDACRAQTKCSAHEYSMFTNEIKSDRDMNIQIASYNAIVDCGNEYTICIVTQCGDKFNKCLGKTASDRATNACAQIAKNCVTQDSGLVARFGNIFAILRTDAEQQVARDEQRLYELRDQMREQCNYLGAMFDERTFDCVYTINFYANNSETPYASKKAYAGSVFDCTPDWFGIDITTFKENAYRLTREQTAASSAMLGSGVGTAVGAISSGAIDRAIDKHKAETDEAKAKCANAGGEWNSFLGKCQNRQEPGGEEPGGEEPGGE
ncbi:MAG: hypothetical protein KBS86_01895 [Proteobacteria bacterium]|nr:hypothetical protein [Candidatus Enterousia scatequi]